MSKKLLLALALALAGASSVWADGIPDVIDQLGGDQWWTITVFNDSGRTIQSGEIAIWDSADSDVTQDRQRFVTVAAAADSSYVAGVMAQTCTDQTWCDLVVKGVALVRCADAQDNVTAGTTVSTASGSANWLCGDYTPAANASYLGMALGSGTGTDYDYIPVFVDPGLDP